MGDRCICTWRTIADVPIRVPIMRNRDPECPEHGDTTDWWRMTQAHARALQTGDYFGREARP